MDSPRIPTDRNILREIYNRHYDKFAAYDRGDRGRESVNYVPIDIESIASIFGVDKNLVFGQLYYHLNRKYGYKQDSGSLVPLFTPVAGKDRHCVNFPFLAATLADLDREHSEFLYPTLSAVLSLLVSIVALAISLRSA
jgi:hypothetical protein